MVGVSAAELGMGWANTCSVAKDVITVDALVISMATHRYRSIIQVRGQGRAGKHRVRGLVGGLTLLNHACNARYAFKVKTVAGKTLVYIEDICDDDDENGEAVNYASIVADEEIVVRYSEQGMGEDCVCQACLFANMD